jgi:hypothetical protein
MASGSAAPRDLGTRLSAVTKRDIFPKNGHKPAKNAQVIDLGSGWISIVLLVAIGLVLGGGALGYVLDPAVFAAGGQADRTTKIIAGCFAVVFLAIAGYALVRAPKVAGKRRALAFDARGVWWSEGGRSGVIPWQDLAAVGLGDGRTQRRSYRPLDNLPVITALELYPTTAAASARVEAEKFRVDAPALRPDLPAVRYRFPIPGSSRFTGLAEQAVQRFAPELWVGRYTFGKVNPLTGKVHYDR